MTAENATAEAQKDVQTITSKTGSGEQVQTLGQEINSARDTFQSPAEYNAYMQTIAGSFKDDPNMLAAVDIYDSGNNDQQLLQQLSRNDENLYKVLDRYSENHGEGELQGQGFDGEVGQKDLDAFLTDYANGTGKAKEIIDANPELLGVLQAQQAEAAANGGETFSRQSLLEGLGYDKNDRAGFETDHPVSNQNTAVFKGANGLPETIVEQNGVSTGLSYDSNGNINGLNYTEPTAEGQQSHKLTRNAEGIMVDENGNPGKMQAPFVDKDGNYGFYSATENPNVYTKNTVDSATGKVATAPIDLADPTVAIAGLNRPLNVDANNQGTFKIGNLEVKAGGLQEGQTVADGGLNAQGQAVYEIKNGDNLTNIVRDAKGLPRNYDGPELEAAMKQLAAANKYQDLDAINAGTTLVIPPDWNTRPVIAPPQATPAAA